MGRLYIKVLRINFEFFGIFLIPKQNSKATIMSPYLFFIIVLFASICFSRVTTSSGLPDATATDSKIEKTVEKAEDI